MYVRKVKNQLGKPMYLIIDDNGKVIKEAYKYILYLARIGRTKGTLKASAYRLKIFYDWLSFKNLTIEDIANGKDTSNTSTLEYLSDFIIWLKYPSLYSKVIEINPKKKMEAKRTNNTVNLIMSTVYGFYEFLSKTEGYKELNVFKMHHCKQENHSLISQLVRKKEAIRSSMLTIKKQKKTIKYITRDEFWKIYLACTSRRNRIICGLMFDGALRVSEVVGLHIEDFSQIFNNRVDVVKREDLENEDAAVKYDSEGYVIIPDYLRDEIVTYLAEISAVDTNYFVFNMWGDTKFEAMKTDTIREMVETTAKRAGIKRKITPHMLRHGVAVELYDIILSSKEPDSPYYGMQVVDIKEKLRHATMQSTEVYAEATHKGQEASAIKHYQEINALTKDGLENLISSLYYKKEK